MEDNPTDVFIIQEVIAKSGLDLRVRVAANGQDALQYLQDLGKPGNPCCPALVLLDLNLPKVPGIEVLRRLRSTSCCRHTPVIVVTSSSAEADRAAVQGLGAEAYFRKPSSLDAYMQLAPLIKQILIPA